MNNLERVAGNMIQARETVWTYELTDSPILIKPPQLNVLFTSGPNFSAHFYDDTPKVPELNRFRFKESKIFLSAF